MSTDRKGVFVRKRRDQTAEEVDSGAAGAESTAPVETSKAPVEVPSTEQAPADGAAVPPGQGGKPQPAGAEGPRSSRGNLWASASPREQEVHGLAEAPRAPAPSRPREEAPSRPAELPTTDDFAAMFAGATVDVPAFDVGDRADVRVVSIARDVLFVELGGKTEGVVDRREFEDEEGMLTVALGDALTNLVVVSMEGGAIRLSRALGRHGQSAEMLADAWSQGIPVEGKVVGTNKGGFDVEVAGVRAFCPVSQIDIDYTENAEEHVGRTYTFRVTRCEEGGRNVVVSRAALLREEREAQAEELMATIAPDAELQGVVSRVEKFGAFVDLGGVDGLVHVSELGWSRVEDPAEVVSVGDRVRVKVLRIEQEERGPRIALSMRALQGDPWDEAFERLRIGDTVTGVVQRLERFGAFVELFPGVDGLVHVSELAHGRRINHPKEIVGVGEAIQVQVLSMDPQRRQIGLSMRALQDDPWTLAPSQFPLGSTVQGTVASTREFGVFVELAGGLTALLPLSEVPEEEKASWRRTWMPGNSIEARVLHVDPEQRRLTLTRRSDDDNAEARAFAEWKSAAAPEKTGGLGTLADALKRWNES